MFLKFKQNGIVKFYNPSKGFGFIYADEEKKDIFFHITKINGANPPKIGDKVSFYINEKKGQNYAYDIDIIYTLTKKSIKNLEQRTKKNLEGFPCIRGETIKGFKVNNIIKTIKTSRYTTVDEAKNELIEIAKDCGANAIFNYIWHRESDWSDDYFLFWQIDRTRKTTFWAEGNAVFLIDN